MTGRDADSSNLYALMHEDNDRDANLSPSRRLNGKIYGGAPVNSSLDQLCVGSLSRAAQYGSQKNLIDRGPFSRRKGMLV